MSVQLRRSRFDELARVFELERQPHAKPFVTPAPLARHQDDFSRDEVEYLSILNESGALVGFFILTAEAGGQSVEFARIVVDAAERGIGQAAIAAMERFCAEELGANRIWLDVFDDNARGIHVYEKLGYRRFNSEPRGERTLHFYEKNIAAPWV